MASWLGNIFRITGPLWRNPPVTSGFPEMQYFDDSFDNGYPEQAVEKSSCHWLEMPWCSTDVIAVIIASDSYDNWWTHGTN